MLASCADTKIVTETVTVEVKVPVYVPLPAELLKACEPRFRYPKDSMPVGAIEDKVDALEDALAMCNNDKELILSKQPKLPAIVQ